MDCMRAIDLLWHKSHHKFRATDKEYIPMKQIKSGKIKQTNVLDKTSTRKHTKKYRLWKRYPKIKEAKSYQNYCRVSQDYPSVRNDARRITRKDVKDQEKNIASHVKCNSKTFLNYINSKTRLKPSMPDLSIDEKEDIKTQNIFEKAEVLGKLFQVCLIRSPTGVASVDKRKYLT